MKHLLLTTIAAALLAGWEAHAVITRHDLSDSDYVVADADYPALDDEDLKPLWESRP